MKKFRTLFALALSVLFTSQLSACNLIKSERGNGNVKKETRRVDSFKGVSASAGINVYLFQGNEEKVVVETDENLQGCIVTKVEGDVLKCYVDCSIIHSSKLNVYVNFKELNKIDASSGSDVYGETVINADVLDLGVSSGAEMKVEVNAKTVTCNVSSGSDATIKGTADFFEADASSGAEISAVALNVKSCDAEASSAGEIEITVTEKIDAKASSGADIKYFGNPAVEKIQESSGGNVTHK